MKENEIVWPCDRLSNETETLKKHVTKYKNMQKWIVEFLRKYENRGIKISPFFITKFLNLLLFTLILYGFGGPLWYSHL